MDDQDKQRQQQASRILDEVYGPYDGPPWRPRGFERTAPRYLWTDAFGVCAFVSLYHATHAHRYLEQAVALMQDVIDTLGHERPGDAMASRGGGSGGGPRSTAPAWLPGANAQHPTRGGLRIGKKHPEGHPDGDGQYFHYLTKAAFALLALSRAAADPKYLAWAIELMQAAHSAFVYEARDGSRRMVWKMSVDLSQPAVPSQGNLDAFDGLVTCTLLQQAAAAEASWGREGFGAGVLAAEVRDLREMVEARYRSYTSDDPLDLGEALWLSHWQLDAPALHHQQQQQQQQQPASGRPGAPWARHVCQVSLASLEQLWRGGYFEQPAQWRLAFRELGTSIGLQALLAVRPDLPNAELWRQRVQQVHDEWGGRLFTRDRDITPVMYATSLVPGVWLSTLQGGKAA